MDVFPLFYFGPISYYAALKDAPEPVFDIFEHYYKQTYRNRMEIYTANGKMTLSIPVVKISGKKTALKDIRISYDNNWQKHHWRSLSSAYSNSPFFLYYQDEIKPLYTEKYPFLFDFNMKSHKIVESLLKTKFNSMISDKYMEGGDFADYRNAFLSKKKKASQSITYPQVFEEKHGFIPDLSILDLLFNEGNVSLSLLSK